MTFGILTLATQNDYLKAIGLALSLKVSNPGVPLAVACTPGVKSSLAPYFDFVIDQRADMQGFKQKVCLDYYSPFEKTLYLDSDILVFKPVASHIQLWGDVPYTSGGKYVTGGFSAFNLDRAAQIQRLGKKQIVNIDGSGHAYFCKPACNEFFDRAREITDHHKEMLGDIRYADEDVIAVAMTEFNYAPVERMPFFSRHVSAKRGTMEMDASLGKCRFVSVDTGQPYEPCMMHFAANEAPIAYAIQLFKLFSRFGLPTRPLYKLGVTMFWKEYIKSPLHNKLRNLGLR